MERLLCVLLWLLGICEKEEDAGFLRRVWVLAGPPLAAFFSLEQGTPLAAWVLLGVLAAGFFWDGLRGWMWGQIWLRRMAWYSLGVFMGLLAISRGLWPEWAVYWAAAPLLWPLTVTGAARYLFESMAVAETLSILGVWGVLVLGHLAGKWVRRRKEQNL